MLKSTSSCRSSIQSPGTSEAPPLVSPTGQPSNKSTPVSDDPPASSEASSDDECQPSDEHEKDISLGADKPDQLEQVETPHPGVTVAPIVPSTSTTRRGTKTKRLVPPHDKIWKRSMFYGKSNRAKMNEFLRQVGEDSESLIWKTKKNDLVIDFIIAIQTANVRKKQAEDEACAESPLPRKRSHEETQTEEDELGEGLRAKKSKGTPKALTSMSQKTSKQVQSAINTYNRSESDSQGESSGSDGPMIRNTVYALVSAQQDDIFEATQHNSQKPTSTPRYRFYADYKPQTWLHDIQGSFLISQEFQKKVRAVVEAMPRTADMAAQAKGIAWKKKSREVRETLNEYKRLLRSLRAEVIKLLDRRNSVTEVIATDIVNDLLADEIEGVRI